MTTYRVLGILGCLVLLSACGEEARTPPARPGAEDQPAASEQVPEEGTVVAQEDFEAGPGVFTAVTGNGSIAPQDGKLAIDPVPSAGPIISSIPVDPPAQVVRIEAQVGASADTFAMVGCSSSTPGTEYRFTVGPGDSSAIYRFENGEATELGRGGASYLDIAGSIDFRAECLGQGPGLPTRLILYDCSECNEVAVDVEDPQGLGDIASVYLGGEELEGEGGLASFDDVRITRY